MQNIKVFYSDSRACVDITSPENDHIKFEPGYYWLFNTNEWQLEEIHGLIRAKHYAWQISRMNGPFRTKNQAINDIYYKFNRLGLTIPNIG
jgi:hypothetical protein